MVIVRFFGQNCLKLELSTFVVDEILIEHKEEETLRHLPVSLLLEHYQNYFQQNWTFIFGFSLI